MRTLLVDNYDSYTYNLFQLLAEVNGEEPVTVRHDDPMLLSDEAADFGNIVVSPGPGRPSRATDLGHVPALLARTELPVLGVCLGHQAIAHLAGGEVGAAPQPRHGHVTTVSHDGDPLFAGLPGSFRAVRYHSLCVREPAPAAIRVTARAEDDVVMALRHRLLPRWGVQFHPESIATEHGYRLLANFRDLSGGRRRRRRRPTGTGSRTGDQSRLRAVWTSVDGPVDAEAVFTWLDDAAGRHGSIWLDSARAEPGPARFSFLAGRPGPLGEVVSWRAGDDLVRVRTRTGLRLDRSGDVLTALQQRLAGRRVTVPGLPFDFTGGYVGYLGYEAKALAGAAGRHRSPIPDAVFTFVDRFVAVDHETGRAYVVALHRPGETERRTAAEWVEAAAERVRRCVTPPPPEPAPGLDPLPYLARGREGYLADIRACLDELRRGESYEICLTNRLTVPFEGDNREYYRRLRRANPAPYAAFLRLPGFTVLSSSPERFLRVDPSGRVESKPIKGTTRRDADPSRDAALVEQLRTSPKTRAENLMIVDLLRNDLGRVCEIGSVEVPSFLAVESYATVHQLVSTVRGRLRPGLTALDCVRACFPGGSMTGAPKLRTLEIIDRLETAARGVYSGALGYFSANGAADLSIVIRTAVHRENTLTVGAGGAIVIDSDPVEEFDEMLLKAAAPLLAWQPAAVVAPVAGRRTA